MNLHRQLTELTATATWTGTATQLLSALGGEGTPEHLSRELSRRATDLAAVGIRVVRKRQAHTGKRLWIIERLEGDGSAGQGDSRVTATSEEGDAEIPKVTVKGETVPVVEGDSNPGMLTVNADATPKTLTINSMTGHPLNWSPCKYYHKQWCLALWPDKAINARALTACPLVDPDYGYQWPVSSSENTLDPSKPSLRDWHPMEKRVE